MLQNEKNKINNLKRKRDDNFDASSIVSFSSDSDTDDDITNNTSNYMRTNKNKNINKTKTKRIYKKRKRGPTNWDQFRAENAGQGWSYKEMSLRYNQLYNN